MIEIKINSGNSFVSITSCTATFIFQNDAKKPCHTDANGDKNNDTIYINLNEPKPATNPIQSQHQNNHHQQLENIDNYSTPTSPAKSEVRFYHRFLSISNKIIVLKTSYFYILIYFDIFHILFCVLIIITYLVSSTYLK